MSNPRFVTFASVISEIQQSDIFMTAKARILETPKANLNGARVTEAFVDEIVSNAERYVGLPLYADVKALRSGKYNRLGHLYDSKTGEFHSTQIGSFYEFAKEEFDGGSYLVGFARIPKRDTTLSKAIAELFAESKLKFSFEISCGEYEDLEDGTFQIDASENNYLEGTAIVTFPACEDAVALELVAQRRADDTERGETEMAETKELVAEATELTETVEETVETAEVAETVEQSEVIAEEKTEETAEEKTEEKSEETEETEENSEDETACKDKKRAEEENAAVYVTEVHTEEVHTCAYDTETGKEVCQDIAVSTRSTDRTEGTLVEADDGIHIAEQKNEDDTAAVIPTTAPAPEVVENNNASNTTNTTTNDNTGNNTGDNTGANTGDNTGDNQNPVVSEVSLKEQLDTLAELVQTLTAEVKALKEERKTHISASQDITAEVNPFVDDMTANGRYSLLEKVSTPGAYSLLSK